MDSSIQSSFGPLQSLLSPFLSGNKSLGTVPDEQDGAGKLNETVENEVKPSSVSSQQALNQRILSSLNSVLASDQSSSIQRFSPAENFTPEGVAATILNAVNGFLAEAGKQGLNDERLDDFFNQVRQGIERGASEAREILSGLGKLSDEVESEIDDTVSLIQQGIDQLEESVGSSKQGASPVVTNSTQTLGASFSRSESGDIQIETQEGDLVSISFNRTQSAEILAYQSVQGRFSVQGFEQATSASASLSFSVEGDLNQEELESINQLLTRIDKVTDKFFDGNLQAAFNKASRLGIDAEQLASFSVSLFSEETRSIAASSSQTFVTPAPSSVAEGSPAIPGLDDDEVVATTHFVDELAGLLNDDAREIISEPESTISNLFNSVLDNKIENNPLLKSLEQDANQLLKSLVEQMSELVKRV